jgi:phospholipid-binding lipoprotein MlaA
MLLRKTKKVFILSSMLFLANCASVENPHPQDPIEKFNRGIYGFNKTADKLVIKPIAYTYKGLVPVAIQQGIGNFFDNLENITTIANDILQLKIGYAIQDTTRLFINTTLGIGGLFDIASRVGVEQRREDFGQTLYHWGYEESSYIVLPFLGPSTLRDTVGRGVDRYALSVWPWIDDNEWTNILTALNIIDTRASLLQKETVLDTIAVDEYTFVRNAYLQRRAFLGNDQATESESASDPFNDFDATGFDVDSDSSFESDLKSAE